MRRRDETLHPLVTDAKKLRLDLPGILVPPANWGLENLNRTRSERAYTHVIRMVSQAVNVDFHGAAARR